MKRLDSDTFTITFDGKTINWAGEIKFQNFYDQLLAFFNEIVKDMTPEHEIIIRFNDLNYMNSSTIQAMMVLLKMLNEQKIYTIVTYDSKINWQRSSFKALEKLNKVLTYIKIE